MPNEKICCFSWLRKLFCKNQTTKQENMLLSTTTVVAIKFGTGVVLGVDGRILASEYGRVAQNFSKKTLRLGMNAIGFSGNTHVLKGVKRRVKRDFTDQVEITFDEVVSRVRHHMHEYAKRYVKVAFAVLVVGRSASGTWSIVELVVERNKKNVVQRDVQGRCAAVGSGKDHAKRFISKPKLENDYPANSTVENRKELAFGALKYAVTRDYGTGGMLHVISLDAADGVNDFFEVQPNGPDYCVSKYEAYHYQRGTRRTLG